MYPLEIEPRKDPAELERERRDVYWGMKLSKQSNKVKERRERATDGYCCFEEGKKGRTQ